MANRGKKAGDITQLYGILIRGPPKIAGMLGQKTLKISKMDTFGIVGI